MQHYAEGFFLSVYVSNLRRMPEECEEMSEFYTGQKKQSSGIQSGEFRPPVPVCFVRHFLIISVRRELRVTLAQTRLQRFRLFGDFRQWLALPPIVVLLVVVLSKWYVEFQQS